MKLLITESQNKNILKSLVKKFGWKNAVKMVDISDKDLAKTCFDDNVNNFLELYKDLDIVPNVDNTGLSFVDKKGDVVFYYRKAEEFLLIDVDYVWTFLRRGFDLTSFDIDKVMNKWFKKAYNLTVTDTDWGGFEKVE